MRSRPRPVRPLLLFLLWIWAGCIALVLDLFLNVEEFDAIRPRAPLYWAMRSVAHGMIGEPLANEQVAAPALRPLRERSFVARGPDAALDRPAGRPGSRHPGKPDARTPQGAKLLGDLVVTATESEDPATRCAALRGLARMFGRQAGEALAAAAGDPAQPAAVRELAANLLGQTNDRRGR